MRFLDSSALSLVSAQTTQQLAVCVSYGNEPSSRFAEVKLMVQLCLLPLFPNACDFQFYDFELQDAGKSQSDNLMLQCPAVVGTFLKHGMLPDAHKTIL